MDKFLDMYLHRHLTFPNLPIIRTHRAVSMSGRVMHVLTLNTYNINPINFDQGIIRLTRSDSCISCCNFNSAYMSISIYVCTCVNNISKFSIK